MDAQTVVGGVAAVVALAGFGWFVWTKIKASKEDDNSGSGGGGGGGGGVEPIVENTPKGKKKVAVRKKAVANKKKGK